MPVKVGHEFLFIWLKKQTNNSLCPAYGNKNIRGILPSWEHTQRVWTVQTASCYSEKKLPNLEWKGFSSENLHYPERGYVMAHAPSTAGIRKQGQESVWRKCLLLFFCIKMRNEAGEKIVGFVVGHETWRDCFFKSLRLNFQDELACGWDPLTTYFCQLKYKLVLKTHLLTWSSITNVFQVFHMALYLLPAQLAGSRSVETRKKNERFLAAFASSVYRCPR